jgi:WD40 repeat protein
MGRGDNKMDLSSVVFFSGIRSVTGSRDQTARVWDARTGKPLLELKGHTGGVGSVAFSPDGTQPAGGRSPDCHRGTTTGGVVPGHDDSRGFSPDQRG